MKKWLAMLCVVTMLLGCATGLAEGTTASSPLIDTENEYISALAGKRVAVANIYLGDEWCKLIADTFEEYGEIYGFEVNNQDGNLDHDTQVKQIENFIIQQYDIILVDPANGAGIGDVLDSTSEKSIPVVAFDAEAEWDGLVAQISADNYGNGVLMGEMVRDYINENLGGTAKIVVLTMYQPHTMAREEGFRSIIDQMEGVEVIATQDCQGNREVAANIINGISEDYDIIFSVVPNGWLGAISALEALGKSPEDIHVFGGVSSDEAYDVLRAAAAGEPSFMIGGWGVDARIVATKTLEAAGRHFLGLEQEQYQIAEALIITKENVNTYYPEEG